MRICQSSAMEKRQNLRLVRPLKFVDLYFAFKDYAKNNNYENMDEFFKSEQYNIIIDNLESSEKNTPIKMNTRLKHALVLDDDYIKTKISELVKEVRKSQVETGEFIIYGKARLTQNNFCNIWDIWDTCLCIRILRKWSRYATNIDRKSDKIRILKALDWVNLQSVTPKTELKTYDIAFCLRTILSINEGALTKETEETILRLVNLLIKIEKIENNGSYYTDVKFNGHNIYCDNVLDVGACAYAMLALMEFIDKIETIKTNSVRSELLGKVPEIKESIDRSYEYLKDKILPGTSGWPRDYYDDNYKSNKTSPSNVERTCLAMQAMIRWRGMEDIKILKRSRDWLISKFNYCGDYNEYLCVFGDSTELGQNIYSSSLKNTSLAVSALIKYEGNIFMKEVSFGVSWILYDLTTNDFDSIEKIYGLCTIADYLMVKSFRE